jgi:hypothetical protein
MDCCWCRPLISRGRRPRPVGPTGREGVGGRARARKMDWAARGTFPGGPEVRREAHLGWFLFYSFFLFLFPLIIFILIILFNAQTYKLHYDAFSFYFSISGF